MDPNYRLLKLISLVAYSDHEHLTKDSEHRRDTDELPDFTLPFVTNLTAEAETLVGEVLVASLGVPAETG